MDGVTPGACLGPWNGDGSVDRTAGGQHQGQAERGKDLKHGAHEAMAFNSFHDGTMPEEPLPFSPACERNKDPILECLTRWLPARSPSQPVRVLEVGAGTGQHAVHMARHLAWVRWRPTERPFSLAPLRRRVLHERATGLAEGARIEDPIALDVNWSRWPAGPFDLVFTANTTHIMPISAIPHLLAGSARVLAAHGLLMLYGPFRDGSNPTAESNAAFDAHLRAMDASMGLRDAVAMTADAVTLGLVPVADEAMPANNRMLIFRRRSDRQA
jgi:hypothetical protein